MKHALLTHAEIRSAIEADIYAAATEEQRVLDSTLEERRGEWGGAMGELARRERVLRGARMQARRASAGWRARLPRRARGNTWTQSRI